MNKKQQTTTSELTSDKKRVFHDIEGKVNQFEIEQYEKLIQLCSTDSIYYALLANKLASLDHVIKFNSGLFEHEEIPQDVRESLTQELKLHYYRRFVEFLKGEEIIYNILKDEIDHLGSNVEMFRDSLFMYEYTINSQYCTLILKSRGGKSPEQRHTEIQVVKSLANSGKFEGKATIMFDIRDWDTQK